MLNGQRNSISRSLCDDCGGESRPSYNWQAPRWISGRMIPTEWVHSVQMEPVNNWTSTLSWEKLNNLFSEGAAGIIRDKLMTDFLQNYGLFAKVFKYVGCDCANPTANCFNDVISSTLGTCELDPSVSGSCLGVKFGNSSFDSDKVVSGKVVVVSSANFVGESNTVLTKRMVHVRHKHLVKRDAASVHDVVKNGDGSVIGQIVGNALGFEFNVASNGLVSVCLPIDTSITQNTADYPILDFAKM
jgi:hypothetical protein